MKLSFFRFFAASLAFAYVSGCSTTGTLQIPLGHSCFKEFSQAGNSGTYVCLFELSAPSRFYDEDQQERVVRDFVMGLSAECRVIGSWEMIRDSPYRLYHTTSYVVHHIQCE